MKCERKWLYLMLNFTMMMGKLTESTGIIPNLNPCGCDIFLPIFQLFDMIVRLYDVSGDYKNANVLVRSHRFRIVLCSSSPSNSKFHICTTTYKCSPNSVSDEAFQIKGVPLRHSN